MRAWTDKQTDGTDNITDKQTWKAKISEAKMAPQWNHFHVHRMDPFQVVILCMIIKENMAPL